MNIFEGLRVVDLTRHISGPYCGQMLADLGATVLKVESLRGDDTRDEEPFADDLSLYFASFNRNKRSIALDLRSTEAKEILNRLVSRGDVILSNYRPGVMDSMGLSYQACRALNPRIVYVAISGYGATGPYRDQPAFDEIIQAMSGLMDLTGEPDGAPTMVGVSVVDLVTAMYTFGATASALYRRTVSGEGSLVEVNLYDAALSLVGISLSRFLTRGIADTRTGARNRYEAGIGTFPTKDGHVQLCAFADGHWQRLAAIVGDGDLATDARYDTLQKRAAAKDTVNSLIEAWTSATPTEEVLSALHAAGVPAAPIRSIEALGNDLTELIESDRVRRVTRPDNGGDLWLMGNPMRISSGDGSATSPEYSAPPALGADTRRSLLDLGYSDAEVRAFENRGVVRQHAHPSSTG